MTRVAQLERVVRTLTRAKLAALRDWFQPYLADEWDSQIEADVKAGRMKPL